jgi:hypothetical protein
MNKADRKRGNPSWQVFRYSEWNDSYSADPQIQENRIHDRQV